MLSLCVYMMNVINFIVFHIISRVMFNNNVFVETKTVSGALMYR